MRKFLLPLLSLGLLTFALLHVVLDVRQYPRSVSILDAILLVFMMGGVRLVWRIYPELMRSKREKRVLIFGAGDAVGLVHCVTRQVGGDS